MAKTRTLPFLPSVFQTETNDKFLSATLDQLVTEPNLVPINGYVGRKFTPGWTGIESYLREPTAARSDYQLEPTTVVKNQTDQSVEFYNTYPELLQKIQYFGGNVANPDRLFSSEYYTYSPKIDYDKFVNFSQYYWLPNGPDAVDIVATSASTTKTFYIYPDNNTNVYNISEFQTVGNPDIVLVRGGTYTFVVNQSGKPFWIQTEPGLTGRQSNNNSLSSREILGVTNNGDDVGSITFTVPGADDQDVYLNANKVQNVNFLTNLKFSQIDQQLLSSVVALGGLDGIIASQLINGRSLIFGTYYTNVADWTSSAYPSGVGSSLRYGVWDISLTPSGSDYLITLTPGAAIPTADKVTIVNGQNFGDTEWYKNALGYLSQVPVITAPLTTLYYQDGVNADQYGRIEIIGTTTKNIDVDTDILGRQNYISPNKIIFSNGLKVKFDNTVTPVEYRNAEYYVDGVGTAITLTAAADLSVFFPFSGANFNPNPLFIGAANAVLSQARNQITIQSNVNPLVTGIETDYVASDVNPNNIFSQDVDLLWPYRGSLNAEGTNDDNLTRPGTIGMSVVGIPIYGPTNNWYLDGRNATVWNYNSPFVLINGQDTYGGFPDDNGVYHYQDSTFINENAWGPVAGWTSYVESDGHSKIIGFAADGYPIYGPFGYINPDSSSSGVARMQSSYQAIGGGAYRPADRTVTVTANNPIGSNLTVSSTFGLEPGMKLTTSSNLSIPTDQYWIVASAGTTATGPAPYPGGSNQIRLNKEITIYANTTLTFSFTNGSFIEDYQYIEGTGSLDRFNGRYCVTPDFPDGTYAYFATQDSSGTPVYPYFIGQNFYGSLDISSQNQLTEQDYITINRSSRDENPWSRRNRWFHKEVLAATATYNNTSLSLSAYERALRPIIEFKPNLQLLNFGKTAKQPVDIIDTQILTPFKTVEGVTGIFLDGVRVVDGMRVIFAADVDPNTRGKIYEVVFDDVDDDPSTPDVLTLTLVPAPDGEPSLNDTVSVLNGLSNVGKSFWYNGTAWIEGQVKSGLNVAPLFDIFDDNGISFADTDVYPVINIDEAFNGCKIFSYLEGTGTNDSVLGFPLTYRSIDNQGDIQFENNFDVDTFSYSIDGGTELVKKVNTGYIYQNNLDGTVTPLSVWSTVNESSKQYQIFSYEFDGLNNDFRIDIAPDQNSEVPNLQVYLNFKRIPDTQYQVFVLPDNTRIINLTPSLLKSGDKIDILVYSQQVSATGYYEIPENLNYNAQNSELTYPTLGQIRNHVAKITRNSTKFIGAFPGTSNLLDLDLENFAGTILQQSSPVTYANMFLTDKQFNFVNSVYNAQQEYTRFKNKFLSLAAQSNQIDYSDPQSGVSYLLKVINKVKNSTFPWYYSDMLGYSDNVNVLNYTVLDPLQTNYEITSTFGLTSLSNKSILVYLNGSQLVNGYDYSFLTTGPGVVLSNSLTRNAGDTLSIYEYNNTDGSYIPETPTKLGLYPKYKPEIVLDNTYITPINVIVGHDGSRTPAFNDFRDNYLLELELRIYNNIKVEYSEDQLSIYNSKPGKYRTNDYSLETYNRIVSRSFLLWAGQNKVDYTTNNTFEGENTFTYNYANAVDSTNARLPGSWRACYEYFYDTQRPHTNPWEMLGFSEIPTWWTSTYGPAPYTAGNTVLWTDLQNGYIAAGDRQGYDSKFARPGLMSIIPVDRYGNLRSPIEILATSYYRPDFQRNWSVGNWGPAEASWRNSSEWPYAQQIVMALTKPAQYFSLGITTDKYRRNTVLDQYLVTGTNTRLTPPDPTVNGTEDSNGDVLRNAGYINWINDYQISNGVLSSTRLENFLQNYTVQLAYRMAGYSDKKLLKILADQNSPSSINSSVIIPDEDYDLVLGRSTPLSNVRYSGVIVKKVPTGYEVSGYDKGNPNFLLVAPDVNNSSDPITVLNETVNWYDSYNRYRISIPYGTVFNNLQELSNFLSGYQRFLQLQGFSFDFFDQDLNQIRNWKLSLREILFWSQQGWPNNSVIVVSPFAANAKINTNRTFVEGIENSYFGTKVMDQNFTILGDENYTVKRDANQFYLTVSDFNNTKSSMIAYLELNLIQIENVLIFNNETQFNDIIYDPQSGERQYRIKIVGQKTADWNGSLYAPGYIYNDQTVPAWLQNQDYLKGDLVEYKTFYYSAKTNLPGTVEFDFSSWNPVNKDRIKTGLLKNFSFNSDQFVDFYDVNKVNIESEEDQLGFGLIGFRSRTYLSNSGIDDTSQLKLYQGFIKQKGTRSAINALANINIDQVTPTVGLDVNELWAFRVGAYGSLDTNQEVEIVLDESYFLNNPSSLTVNANNSITYSSVIESTRPNDLYRSTTIPFVSPFLLTRTNNSVQTDDILTAGYPNIEDVDYTIFNLNDFESLNADINNIGTGNTIWTAIDLNNTWNVFYVTGTKTQADAIRNNLNQTVVINTETEHGLSRNDIILLQDAEQFTGFYKVLRVNTAFSFVVETGINLSGFSIQTFSAPIYRLQSLRFDYASQITSFTPIDGWTVNSKAWINYNTVSNEWGVYNKSEPWTPNIGLPQSQFYENGLFGTSVKISTDNNFVLVGQPGYQNGQGSIINYKKTGAEVLSEDRLVIPAAGNTVGFGSKIDSANNVIAVSAPTSGPNGEGYVYIYERDFAGTISLLQILAGSNSDTRDFGSSISMSDDNQWLYVGAPGSDEVYVYGYAGSLGARVNTLVVPNANVATFSLDFDPINAELLTVANSLQNFVPYIDYTVGSFSITFTSNAQPDTVIVRQQGRGFSELTSIQGTANTSFGYSVASSTEGAQVVIGAPTANVTVGNASLQSAGEISVYDRSIEKYIAIADQTLFGGYRPLSSLLGKVYVNDELQVLGIDYNIVFSNWVSFFVAPGAGNVITIETNEINLIETTNALTPLEQTQFGYSVDLCPYNCSIYSGAPYYNSNESLGKFSTGAVYRHLNQARIYGNITGTVQNPTVTPDDRIRLNDYEVLLTGSTLDEVVSSINTAGVPGVTAANANGYLSIVSDGTIVANKLRVLPSFGTALTDLGLDIFVQTQVIENPTNFAYDQFGQSVKIDTTAERLLVGSTEAITVVDTTFDKATFETTFDSDGTIFKDEVDAGAVWIFNYLEDARNNINNPSLFAYVQQLKPSNISAPNFNITEGMKFGSGFDISAETDKIYVGASNESSPAVNGGAVTLFRNLDNLYGWDLYRSQEAKVDINGLIKGFIYSAENQTIIENLDYIDPAKGKILGRAEQDITFKVDYDPAVYNNGTLDTVSIDPEFHWSQQQVGQVWWDLSTVRYLDYEQGSVLYRTTNWGRPFPGSSIDVYEWVESNYPPNRYVETGGDGEPKYPDNSAYATVAYVDPQTNNQLVKYFYWVKNKTNVTANQFGRTIPTISIAELIRNPKGSATPYFAAIRPDSVALYNVLRNIVGRDTIFHLGYATEINSNIIHSEYALLSENGTNADGIPTNIFNKLTDSLAGIDRFGNQVPDPSLGVQQRYGIEIRPRQSIFIDNLEAVKAFVTYCNSVFAENLIAEGYNLNLLQGSVLTENGAGEQIPSATSGEWDLQVSSYDELTYINILIQPVDYKVLVISDRTVGGLWTIYTKQNDNTWLLTRVQSYRTSDYWEFTDWYAPGFSGKTVPTYTVNTLGDLTSLTDLKTKDIVKVNNSGQNKWILLQVFPNVINTVGVEDGTIKFLESLYDLEAYNMGWDADLWDSQRWDQNPSLETRQLITAVKDNLFINQLSPKFLELFFVCIYYALQEQKNLDWVFKTSLIDVKQKIDGLNQPQIYSKDDQDFYKEYIEEVKPYHTTIKDFIVDYQGNDNWTGYATDFDLPAYFDTVNQTYRSPTQVLAQDVTALQNLLIYRDWNLNYTYSVGEIAISDSGYNFTSVPTVTITGSAIGNDAVARAFLTNGQITKIEVLYGGSDYITNPVITITGDGVGGSAYAVLKNDTIRKLKTTLKYDRITYNTTVLEWTANTSYSEGDIVTFANIAYEVINPFTTGSTFSGDNLVTYSAQKFDNANDRIQSYYYAEQGQPGKNFGLLQHGIDYPGVSVEGPLFTDAGGFDIGNWDIAPFDALEIDEDGTFIISETLLDSKIESLFADSSLGTRPEDINIDGGPFISDQVLDWQENTYFPQGTVIKNNGAYYFSNVGITTGSTFDVTPWSVYPINPYTAYGPHAPEELVPGRVYDTLDMTVYTFATNAASSAYSVWANTVAFSVANISVRLPGLGYTPGNVSAFISGGDGSGATAQVLLDGDGRVTAVQVVSAGSQYTHQPNISILGPNTIPATAKVNLEQTAYDLFQYRIFKDMNDNYTYLRVSDSASTTVASFVDITSNTIVVTDSSVLPQPAPYGAKPGVIFINGERITYYAKDDTTNTLSQLRRGTLGTGVLQHHVGADVVSGAQDQVVPYSDNYVWYGSKNQVGTINVSTTSTRIEGTNTTFVGNISEGTAIYNRINNELIGIVGNVISDTQANLTSNATWTLQFAANNISYATGVDTVGQTTAGVPVILVANLAYIRSNLWLNSGTGTTEITTEDVVFGNIPDYVTTESNTIISTESTFPTPADGNGLFSSTKTQAVFVKQN